MLPTGGLNLEFMDREDGLGPVIDSWRSLRRPAATPSWRPSGIWLRPDTSRRERSRGGGRSRSW